MENKLILADISILIDYFRKTYKANSILVKLLDESYDFSIAAITHYEIYSGATLPQLNFWRNVLVITKVLPFDHTVAEIAVKINEALKRKRKQIDIADLFIAATAMSNKLPLTTLNTKHFDRIDRLEIISA